jgi:hypothetical protein
MRPARLRLRPPRAPSEEVNEMTSSYTDPETHEQLPGECRMPAKAEMPPPMPR